MNETPIFMKHAIIAIRESARDRSLAYVVRSAANELYGSPSSEGEFMSFLDRPKTPTSKEIFLYKSCSRWLARYFNPVFMAFADGLEDKEILSIWIMCNRVDTGKMAKRMTKRLAKQINAETQIIRFRERDKRRDWNTVK